MNQGPGDIIKQAQDEGRPISLIDSFRGPFDFLSNFFPAEVSYAGVTHPSVEHAYQFSKTIDPAERREFVENVTTAADAKRRGKELTLRRDWEGVKEAIMLDLLRKKFDHETLGDWLLLTSGIMLMEGNTWGDHYWGVCRGTGMNRLGVLLMQVREELPSRRSRGSAEPSVISL